MRKMSTKTFKSNKGFTLVELVVVITILAILAVVAINGVGGIIQKSKASADLAIASNLGSAAAAAFLDNKIDFGAASSVEQVLINPAATPAVGTISTAIIGPGLTYTTVPQVQGIPSGNWMVRVSTSGVVEVATVASTIASWPSAVPSATNQYCILYPKDPNNFVLDPYTKLK